jgi:hypothetical protein
MKRLSFYLLLASSVLTAGLEQGERDRAMSHLHSTRKMLADSIIGLSQAQLQWKPAPDRWSVAECVEHLALSEDFLFQRAQKLLESPATEKRSSVKDEEVLKMIASREQRVQAPEQLKPSAKFSDAKQALEHFNKSRYNTIKFVETSDADFRDHVVPSPAGGTMDAYQSLLMIAAHTERHVAQINEVKADPKFPKK